MYFFFRTYYFNFKSLDSIYVQYILLTYNTLETFCNILILSRMDCFRTLYKFYL